MTIEFLGLRWLLLIGVACTTMGSFAASGMQIQPMSGVGIGYDGAEAFNQRYDAAPGSACDNKQPKMADEGTFFGSMTQFNAVKTGQNLLPQFTASTVDDVVSSAARARSAQITEGGRAIGKKLGHAESGGYTSAFQGVAPTQANAESLIRNIMSKPSVTDYGHTWIDVYNSTGQGVRFGAQNGHFERFIELQLRTR